MMILARKAGFGVSLAAILLAAAGGARADVSSDVLNLTGGKRARLVWSRDTASPYNHVFGGHNVYKLMGFDTSEGAERVILGTVSDYSHPRLTHDGNTVVYTNYKTNEVYAVNWDGSNRRKIVSSARHGCLWYDESAGKQFIVYQSPVGKQNPLYLVDVNNTSDKRFLYSSLYCTIDWLSISPDGSRLGGSFPWDSCGVVTLSGPSYVEFDKGCWASVTPDSTYRFGTFDGAHRNWKVRDADRSNYRLVSLNGGVGVDGWEIYHPRFAANDAGFCTVNGPYSVGPMGGNNIGAGGGQVELYLGKFDAGITQVTAWAKVTYNGQADFFGHAWVDHGPSAPVMSLSPTDLSFSATEGGSNPSPRTVSVTNSGGGTLDAVSVSESCSWLTVTRSGSGNSQTLTNSVNISGLGAGARTATVTVSCGNASNSPRSYDVTLNIGGLLAPPVRINCGSNDYTPSGWGNDDEYVDGGNDYVFGGSWDTTAPDAAPESVYGTCRHLDHTYSFPVADGTYTVRLHFGDAYGGGRAMDYTIEGVKVIDGLDIAAEVGTYKALVKEFTVTVADGDGLQITARKDGGNDVFECGIEILAGAAEPTPPAPPTGLAATAASSSQIDLHWDDNSEPDLAGYNVYRGTAPGFTPGDGSRIASEVSSSAYSDAGLSPATTCYYKVTAVNGAGDESSPSDWTSATTVGGPSDPSITMITPDGGELLVPGTTFHITWTTANLDDVSIFYSADGGRTVTMIAQTVFVDDPEWGNYPWVVPDEPSDECLIHIVGYFGEAPTWSAGTFTIGAAGDGTFGESFIGGGFEANCGGAGATALVALTLLAAILRRRSI